jgi:prenyltransferase beta subunit
VDAEGGQVMLTTETLIEAANKAKSLADEIELLNSINAHDERLYVVLRRSITDPEVLSSSMLREVLEKGLTALRNIKADELTAVLFSVQCLSLTAAPQAVEESQ